MNIKKYWQNLKYWKKGFFIGVLLLIISFLYVIINISTYYNGKCGGYIPFLSAPYSCSYFKYIVSELNFTFLVLIAEFWWAFVLVILIPILIGSLMDKYKK